MSGPPQGTWKEMMAWYQAELARAEAETETLRATLHGMQDGALVRDQLALIARLERDLKTTTAQHKLMSEQRDEALRRTVEGEAKNEMLRLGMIALLESDEELEKARAEARAQGRSVPPPAPRSTEFARKIVVEIMKERSGASRRTIQEWEDCLIAELKSVHHV